MRSDKELNKIACVVLPFTYSNIKELHEIIDVAMLKNLIQSVNCTLEQGEGFIKDLLESDYIKFKGNKIYEKVTIDNKYCAIIVGVEKENFNNIKESNNTSVLNEVWEVMFSKLTQYMKKNKHFPDIDEDEEMNNWMVNTINSRKNGELLEVQIKKLDSINFIWNISNLKWEQNFASVVKFLQKNNRWPNDYDDNKIYSWISTQRSTKKNNKLSKYRIEKLESIGMVWDARRATFINKCNSLNKFMMENNGQYPSQQSTDSEERTLYNFIRSVRFMYLEGKLEEYKIEILTGFRFLFHREEIWEYKYEMAKAWINNNGKFPKCNNSKKEERIIYSWLKNQSQNYINNKLIIEQKIKLNKIKIKDFIENIENNKKKESTKTIEEIISSLEVYFDKYGKLPVYSEKAKLSYLATYCTKLRKLYMQEELTKEQISTLVKLNFKFDILKSNENKFNAKLLKLERFKIANPGRWPSTESDDNDEKKLAFWLNNQKSFYNKGKLPVDRVLKLEELGVKFERIRKKK